MCQDHLCYTAVSVLQEGAAAGLAVLRERVSRRRLQHSDRHGRLQSAHGAVHTPRHRRPAATLRHFPSTPYVLYPYRGEHQSVDPPHKTRKQCIISRGFVRKHGNQQLLCLAKFCFFLLAFCLFYLTVLCQGRIDQLC